MDKLQKSKLFDIKKRLERVNTHNEYDVGFLTQKEIEFLSRIGVETRRKVNGYVAFLIIKK